ncbi:MAG: MFS transporter [Halorientalis sp.]
MDIWSDPVRRRWIVWTALATAFLLVNVHRLSTAVLSEDLMRAFDTTGTALGTLHSAFFYVYAPMQVLAGVLADRLGIRRTATVGTVVMSVGGIAFGLADTYAVAFLSRLLIGLGGSVVFISILRFCANWFRPNEFATMNGLTVGVAGLGGILATTPLAVTVAALGVRTTLLGIGVGGLLIAVVVWVLARDTPEDAGLEPVDNVPSAPTLTLREVGRNVRAVFSQRETWLAGLALFTSTGLNITVLGLWGVPYVSQVYGVSITTASTLTLLGSVGLLVGPPVVGRLSDRLGRRTDLMIAGAVGYTATFATLSLLGKPPFAVVGLCFFLASFLAGSYALGYTVVKNRHSAGASGVATGAVNAVAFGGAAVFPTIMGAILDAYWTGETVAGARVYTMFGYRVMFGLAAVSGFVSLLCVSYLHLRTGGAGTGAEGGAVEG